VMAGAKIDVSALAAILAEHETTALASAPALVW
jgi:hypothetical protein